LFAHDLFGKPVSTFPDHALGRKSAISFDHGLRPVDDSSISDMLSLFQHGRAGGQDHAWQLAKSTLVFFRFDG
jgi:hypothetical protein